MVLAHPSGWITVFVFKQKLGVMSVGIHVISAKTTVTEHLAGF